MKKSAIESKCVRLRQLECPLLRQIDVGQLSVAGGGDTRPCKACGMPPPCMECAPTYSQ